MSDGTVRIDGTMIGKLVKMIEDGKLTSASAKKVWEIMLVTGKQPEDIASEMGIVELTEEEIRVVIRGVLETMPEDVALYRSGRDKLFGRIMGQVMRTSLSDSIDPKWLGELLRDELSS